VVSTDCYSERLKVVVAEFVDILHDHILAVLMAAQANGQLSADEDAESLADFVTVHVQGMLMLSRKGEPKVLDNSIMYLKRMLTTQSE
jgi:hypothetical protein